MNPTRFYRFGLVGLAWGLTLAAVVGLGGEALLPGHHVHLGSGGHHHHFFTGSHDHGEAVQEPSGDHDHDAHGDSSHECEQHASAHGDSTHEGQNGPPEPSPEESSSPGLIEELSLYTPSAAYLTALMLVEEPVALAYDAPAIPSDSRLPGGARAPPSLSLS